MTACDAAERHLVSLAAELGDDVAHSVRDVDARLSDSALRVDASGGESDDRTEQPPVRDAQRERSSRPVRETCNPDSRLVDWAASERLRERLVHRSEIVAASALEAPARAACVRREEDQAPRAPTAPEVS